jgi:protein gp37
VGETTISWTDFTFNPWWGCVKISPACTNCYAATFDKRVGGDHWGAKAERRFFGDKHWDEPRKWNEAAARGGVRRRVFCASMADVFEDRDDLVASRGRLWQLIDATPHLDWLLLTKRPENIASMMAPLGQLPQNVWIGTTVESQEYAVARIPHLLAVPASVHFLSCEPLLGRLDLGGREANTIWTGGDWLRRFTLRDEGREPAVVLEDRPRIDWVIAGAESGPRARPQNLDDFRSLRDQCARAGVPFFLKQGVEVSAESPVLIGEARFLGAGPGSRRKGPGARLIELPYLDGVQHAAFPEVAR